MRCALTILVLLTIAQAGAPAPASGTVVSDDFERHTLGSNWIVLGGSGSIGIVGQSDLGLVAGPARGGATEWGAGGFLADQFSEAMISPDRNDSMLTQVFVRHRVSDNARYGFHWNNGLGGRWEIKYDGVPTAQTRILASIVAPEPAAGDRIRIEARGSRISGYHNGALILSAEDTSPDAITATGRLGVVFRFTTTFPATYPSAVFEEWTGGDLPASVSVGPPKGGAPPPHVTIQPHPVVGRSTVAISGDLPGVGGVTFSLYDASGRLIHTREVRDPGGFTFEGTGMPAGVYFYRLSASRRPLAHGRLVIER